MARPIKETPILFGEDARRFEARMKEKRTLPKEEVERIQRHYKTVMKWMENGRKYEEELRARQSKEADAK